MRMVSALLWGLVSNRPLPFSNFFLTIKYSLLTSTLGTIPSYKMCVILWLTVVAGGLVSWCLGVALAGARGTQSTCYQAPLLTLHYTIYTYFTLIL